MPSTRAWPAVMESMPISILMVVLLPAPLGPSSPNVLPRGIVSDRVVHRQRCGRTAWSDRPVSMAGSFGAGCAHGRLLPSLVELARAA